MARFGLSWSWDSMVTWIKTWLVEKSHSRISIGFEDWKALLLTVTVWFYLQDIFNEITISTKNLLMLFNSWPSLDTSNPTKKLLHLLLFMFVRSEQRSPLFSSQTFYTQKYHPNHPELSRGQLGHISKVNSCLSPQHLEIQASTP